MLKLTIRLSPRRIPPQLKQAVPCAQVFMDRASKITVTTDAKGIHKLAEDPDLVTEYFGDGVEALAIKPISVEGTRLAQLALAGELEESWGTALANRLPWAVALTYGTESGAENFARVVTPAGAKTLYFEGPADLLATVRAIEEATTQAQPVDDEALETLKWALRDFGAHLEGDEDAAA